VRYTPKWESLADALVRVIATSLTEDEAKADICRAVADGKIHVRVKISAHDVDLAGSVLPSNWVHVPAYLAPAEFDWTSSRPHKPWLVGPPVGPQSYTAPYLNVKPRQIDLIELLTTDVESIVGCLQFRFRYSAKADDDKNSAIVKPDRVTARNSGPKKRRGRKPLFGPSIRQAVFDLMKHHGDLSDDDPDWSVQADVERAVSEKLGENGAAVSTVRKYVSKAIVEWRESKTTR
jgi:hypothetical protein